MEDTTLDFLVHHDSLSSPQMPSPLQFLGRQSHTRHGSFDMSQHSNLLAGGAPSMYGATPTARSSSLHAGGNGRASASVVTNTTSSAAAASKAARKLRTIQSSDNLSDGFSESHHDESSVVSSSSTVSSTEEVWDSAKSRIQAGKYVFLTLRLALLNSLVIIAVGCIGFWVIEGFSLVDSWYFATVLLTTVGYVPFIFYLAGVCIHSLALMMVCCWTLYHRYGDIVPVTGGGKLFATVYILVAGTILLNNMSSISMIPLELRRRRIQRTILTQFGDHLDDAALRELATGPVVQRLRLAANRTDGLDECTREMFSLAMLVRLGKVTEHDIRETFASFRHLDVNNEGVLNSKSIIAGMIAKQRNSRMSSSAMTNNVSCPDLHALGRPLNSGTAATSPLQPSSQHSRGQPWFGRQESLPITEQERQNHYYIPDSYAIFGERSTLIGMEPEALPDDEEHVTWLP
jgi:hypothetical protein